MPEMDGFEFVAHLRENPKWRSLPVVVLTSTKLSTEDQAHLHGYVDTIFQKESYSHDQLLELVQRQIATTFSTRYENQMQKQLSVISEQLSVVSYQ
jgi:CheY-like chemotaxis protein